MSNSNPLTQLAIEHAKTLNELRRQGLAQALTKQDLLYSGAMLQPLSYGTTEDHVKAAANMLYSMKDHKHGLQWLLPDMLIPQSQMLYRSAALWAHCGFPQIIMGHKYAAALMATKLSIDIADQIRPPWPAFMIDLPRDLLPVLDSTIGKEVSLTCALVAVMDNAWTISALSEGIPCLFINNATIERMLTPDEMKPRMEGEEDRAFKEETTDLDDRTLLMLSRLVLNVCVAMTNPANVKAPKDNSHDHKKKRKNDEPTIRTYVLGTTPAIDCREALRTYIRTGKTSHGLTVQFMVAGHWRNQAHGPGFSLRKTIWIEPFWKGSEDAPILSTPRKLE